MARRGYDMAKLHKAMDMILSGKRPLPAIYRDHQLKGRWQYHVSVKRLFGGRKYRLGEWVHDDEEDAICARNELVRLCEIKKSQWEEMQASVDILQKLIRQKRECIS